MSDVQVVALSGGKDSTAMALRLAEVKPGRETIYLCTPTGDESGDTVAHWDSLERLLGQPIQRVTNRTLNEWIAEYNALPNWRQRWCTRLLKIEPCKAFLARLVAQGKRPTLCVGLRADEERRAGVIYTGTIERYPLREWGWGLSDVREYLSQRGIAVPPRTDCQKCFYQSLADWWHLWRHHPGRYAEAEADEARVGHTYRSPTKDTWPGGAPRATSQV